MKQKISYIDAMAQVEQILEQMNTQSPDIDTLAEKVAKASELLALCKDKLRKVEEDVDKIINPSQN